LTEIYSTSYIYAFILLEQYNGFFSLFGTVVFALFDFPFAGYHFPRFIIFEGVVALT